MSRNPFQYGSPVGSKHFAGRAEELKALTARMADGINVVLVSPRRYGKTSLLLRAQEELGQLGAAMVHVDILRCASSAELATTLAGEAFRLPSGRWHRVKNTVSEFAHRLKVSPTITFSPDGSPQFSFTGDLARRDVHQVLEDVYALLAEETARRSGVLVLDEFQAITDLDEHLPAVLKALSDAYGSVSLVLAGSRRHLMERLTGSTGAPLYGMAEPLALGPVATADMADYLRRRASEAGKPMTAHVAGRVIDIAGPSRTTSNAWPTPPMRRLTMRSASMRSTKAWRKWSFTVMRHTPSLTGGSRRASGASCGPWPRALKPRFFLPISRGMCNSPMRHQCARRSTR